MMENHIVPTNDYLRQIIGNSYITEANLKKILRQRGVFTSSSSKKIIAPIIIKTGISPNEYNQLADSYKSSENQLKSKNRSIAWQSKDSLIDSIPANFDYSSLLEDDFGTCNLVSQPYFVTIDNNPNCIALDFEIERKDLTKNLGENITHHSGRLELKKDDQEMQVSININHTSKETLKFINILTKNTIEHFKSEGRIDKDAEIINIRFYDFNNKNRILFLLQLSQKVLYTDLTFKDTKNVQICPDDDISNPPDDIKWMRDKIENLKLSGRELHNTFFIKEKNYFDYILMFGITCSYYFEGDDFTANCEVEYEFSSKKDLSDGSELTLNINVTDIKTNDNKNISKSKASKLILDSLEKYKLESYKEYKKT